MSQVGETRNNSLETDEAALKHALNAAPASIFGAWGIMLSFSDDAILFIASHAIARSAHKLRPKRPQIGELHVRLPLPQRLHALGVVRRHQFVQTRLHLVVE